MGILFVSLFLAHAQLDTAWQGNAPYSDALLFLDEPDAPALLRYLRERPSSPLTPRANFLLGAAYLRTGRYEDAVLALELARSQMGELSDFVSLRLGEALMRAGYDDAAYRVLDELAEKPLDDGTKEDVAEWLAAVSFRLGKVERAAEISNTLLVKTADERRIVRLLMMQADWHAKQRNDKEAIAVYKRVWIYYPHFAESETARNLAMRLGEERKEAIALDVDEKLARARELARLGRDEEAENLLLAVLTEHKDLAPERRAHVLLRRANSAIRRKLPELAVELCNGLLAKPVVQSNKELRHEVLRVLARSLSSLQRYPEAAAAMNTLATESSNPKVRKEAQLLRAVLIRDSGKVKESQALLLKFIERYSSDPKANDARWFLGWSRYRAGELDGAQKVWRAVVDRSSASALVPRIYYWIARIKEQQGQLAEAQALFERVREDDPWSYYAWLAQERLLHLDDGNTRALGLLETKAASEVNERPSRNETSVLRFAAGAIPHSLKAFARASLFWQLGQYSEASRAMREVPIPEGADDALLLAQLSEKLEDHFRGFVIAKKRFAKMLREPLEAQTDTPMRRSALELAYPRAFERFVSPAARRFQVPSELVFAVMRQESTFQTEAKSWADAQGLLQLIPKTAQKIAREIGDKAPASFVAPELNIRLGTAYLSRLFANFGGNPALTAAAYNAGPFSVDQWLLRSGALPFDVFVEEIPYRETRDYVKKVVANFAAYRRIYQRERTPLAGYFEPMPQASRGLIDY